MYQSESAYFVFGLTVIGALIHFASPVLCADMVTPRLRCPSLPSVCQTDEAVLLPQALNVQSAGDPAVGPADSALGLLTRFVVAASANTVRRPTVARPAATTPTIANRVRRETRTCLSSRDG